MYIYMYIVLILYIIVFIRMHVYFVSISDPSSCAYMSPAGIVFIDSGAQWPRLLFGFPRSKHGSR